MHSLHPKLFLPAAHALGAAVVACLLLAYYGLAHAPLARQEQQYNQRCEQLKQGLHDSLEVRRDHLQLTKKLQELQTTIAEVHKRLPAVSIESRFLARATAAAESQRIRLERYDRDGLTVGNRYGEVRVVLRGAGSHAAICRFLKNLSDFPHTAVLTRVEISSANASHDYPFTLTYLLYHDIAAARTAWAPGPNAAPSLNASPGPNPPPSPASPRRFQ